MDKFYYELSIESNVDRVLLTDFILEFVDAVEDNDDKLIVRSESDLVNLEYALSSYINALNSILSNKPYIKTTLTKMENVDWIKSYQKSVASIEVGEFYIHPSWNNPSDDKINITIDPSFAFGSGHHSSTNSCLRLISKYVQDKNTVIDVGCGSGILAIASEKRGAIVDICDTDKIAIVNAKDNFELNNSKISDSWVGSANMATKKYNVVIANIVADILVIINKDLKKLLYKDSILIVSGIMDKHKYKIDDKYSDMVLLEQIKDNEWYTNVYKGS